MGVECFSPYELVARSTSHRTLIILNFSHSVTTKALLKLNLLTYPNSNKTILVLYVCTCSQYGTLVFGFLGRLEQQQQHSISFRGWRMLNWSVWLIGRSLSLRVFIFLFAASFLLGPSYQTPPKTPHTKEREKNHAPAPTLLYTHDFKHLFLLVSIFPLQVLRMKNSSSQAEWQADQRPNPIHAIGRQRNKKDLPPPIFVFPPYFPQISRAARPEAVDPADRGDPAAAPAAGAAPTWAASAPAADPAAPARPAEAPPAPTSLPAVSLQQQHNRPQTVLALSSQQQQQQRRYLSTPRTTPRRPDLRRSRLRARTAAPTAPSTLLSTAWAEEGATPTPASPGPTAARTRPLSPATAARSAPNSSSSSSSSTQGPSGYPS